MAPKNKGENSKKAAGNAKKAEAAAQKDAVVNAKKAKEEEQEWSKGAKDDSKKYTPNHLAQSTIVTSTNIPYRAAAAEKAAEAARKKAEKDALLKEEEASQPSKPKGANAKTAVKKSRGLDLSQLDGDNPNTNAKPGSLNATGIDNALDLLSLTASSNNDKIDRHPERRFKAAYAAFEERRLEEMADEKGLRRQQKIDQIRKEFEKHPDNPFNQALIGGYDMTKEEMAELKKKQREAVENRLGGA